MATKDILAYLGALNVIENLGIIFDSLYPEILEDLTCMALKKMPNLKKLHI